LDIYFTICKLIGNDNRNIDFVIEKIAKDEFSKTQFYRMAINKLFENLSVKSNFPASFINCFVAGSGAIALFDKGEKILLDAPVSDSTRMNLADYYKKRGFYYSSVLKQNSKADMYFGAALNYYQLVNEEYKSKVHYFDKVNWNNSSITNYLWILSPNLYNDFEIVSNYCRTTTIGSFHNIFIGNNSAFVDFLIKNRRVYSIDNDTYLRVLYNNVSFGKDQSTISQMNFLLEISNGSTEIQHNLLAKIGLYESYILYRNNEIENGNAKLDSLFKVLPKLINQDNGWIEGNSLILAQNGDTTRAIKLLSYVKSAEEKNKILLKICYQLQEGPGVEYTYFYLNKLLKNYSNDAKIGMALYRVLGKIGGYEAEKNQARQKYRNTPELMKPKALQNWVLGTAENGNYYKAKQLIPENVSETKELILMNQILSTEIIKQSKKSNENAWQGNWNDARYFDLDLFPGRNNNDFQFNSLE
jgi:hypothetical protein